MRKFIAATLIASAAFTTPALAKHHGATVCEKAFSARQSVIHEHGHRAPGRNICRFGVKHTDGSVTQATYQQKKRYLNQLRLLRQPFAFPALPRLKPAGVMTAKVGYAIPAYIVNCESHGNPTAVNYNNPNRPAGLYQIITSTWLAFGGGKYAPTADRATPSQQGIVAARIYATPGGPSQWACS